MTLSHLLNFARIYFQVGALRFSKTLLYSIKHNRKNTESTSFVLILNARESNQSSVIHLGKSKINKRFLKCVIGSEPNMTIFPV